MKVGLYSITYLGVWYRGAALTLSELIDRASVFGYDGIEIDGKRPHGNPLDLAPAARAELRRQAAGSGIEIYALAANNDFSGPIPEQREAQLVYTRELIRLAADLGAPVLRVFAAWPGVTLSANGGRYDHARAVWDCAHQPFGDAHAWDACRSGLSESARWAADYGITLALQNHPPLLDSLEKTLRMVDEVASPALKICWDAPLARKQGVEDMQAAAPAVAGRQVLTHFGGEYEEVDGTIRGYVRNRDGTLTPEDFYASFARGMRDIGYGGYTGYELCHPLPQVDGITAGIDFVDRNARLAAAYMRRIIAGAAAAAA